jgi:hypothetical protein
MVGGVSVIRKRPFVCAAVGQKQPGEVEGKISTPTITNE